MSPSRLRVSLGLLLAPGAPALLFYVLNLFYVSRAEAALGGVLLGIPAYAVAVAAGIPACFMLRRRGAPGLPACLSLGALAGLLATGYGAIAGGLFWLIALRRRTT